MPARSAVAYMCLHVTTARHGAGDRAGAADLALAAATSGALARAAAYL